MNFVKPANSFKTLVCRGFIKNVISNSKPMHKTQYGVTQLLSEMIVKTKKCSGIDLF